MEMQSLELLHAEMEAKSHLAAASGDQATKKHLEALCATEAQVAMYGKVKAVRGKTNKGGLTSLEVPTDWPAAHSPTTRLSDLPDPRAATDW